MFPILIYTLTVTALLSPANALRLTNDADFEYQNTPWPDGSKILFTQWVDANYNDLYTVTTDGSGTKTKLNPQDHTYNHPDVDPTGSLICYATGVDNTRTWEVTVLNVADSTEIMITDNEALGLDSQYPRFNGAGDKIAYVQRNWSINTDTIVTMNLHGANAEAVLALPSGPDELVGGMDWLGGSDYLIYTTAGGGLYKVNVAADSTSVRLGGEDTEYVRAQSNPDGSKIVASEGPDRQHLRYITLNPDGSDKRVIVDTDTDDFPYFRGVYCQVCWNADGSGIIAVADLPDAPDFWDLFVIAKEDFGGE